MRANVGITGQQRPDLVGAVPQLNCVADPDPAKRHQLMNCYDAAAFALPAQFTFGNASRNSVLAPGYADVDAGLQKDVALPNGARLQFRLEIFNLLNHANFDVPNRTAFTPNFGRIFSAWPARQMQLGVKMLF